MRVATCCKWVPAPGMAPKKNPSVIFSRDENSVTDTKITLKWKFKSGYQRGVMVNEEARGAAALANIQPSTRRQGEQQRAEAHHSHFSTPVEIRLGKNTKSP